MYFRSTVPSLNDGKSVSFKDAVLRCLPEEGGLYVPEAAPDLRPLFLHMGPETGYAELAGAVTSFLFEADLNPLSASRIAEEAFSFEPELVRLDKTFSVLNLYNGPTGVFKDFGASFLAALLEELLEKDRAMVIAAARGNTGVSIARAFEGRKTTTVLLYPDEPIRGLDPSASVPAGGNVIPIRVKGSLDDCQKLTGEVIRDRSFAGRYRITGGNAINPGRLLPQLFYFLYAFIRLKKEVSGELFFSIPSGNFGNLIAGLYAWKFGMPVNGYIAAMNRNNPFGEAFGPCPAVPPGSGEMPIIRTISPALDVRRPSNYERLASFYEEAPAVLKNMVFPRVIDDDSTLATMETVWKRYGIHLDPHSAVAFAAAEKTAADREFDGHIVILATGHPAKYPEAAFKASGRLLALPEKLASLDRETEPVAEIEPDLEGLESAIAGCF